MTATGGHTQFQEEQMPYPQNLIFGMVMIFIIVSLFVMAYGFDVLLTRIRALEADVERLKNKTSNNWR